MTMRLGDGKRVDRPMCGETGTGGVRNYNRQTLIKGNKSKICTCTGVAGLGESVVAANHLWLEKGAGLSSLWRAVGSADAWMVSIA